ncbi:MAG: tetratricopeptide repeat protein [Bacteroidota bacterium]
MIFLQSELLPQQPDNIYSESSRLKFANYLFKNHDYLRAIGEYKSVPGYEKRDTLLFRIAYSFEAVKDYPQAEKYLESIDSTGRLRDAAAFGLLRLALLKGDIDENIKWSNRYPELFRTDSVQMLMNTELLLHDKSLPRQDKFVRPFPPALRPAASELFERRMNPPYRSPWTAAIMSAVVPGSGKIYSGRIAEGITAAIVNGLLIYGAYDNFRAGHDFRAWMLSAAGGWFYLGNVYGSAAAAKLYNAEAALVFSIDVRDFLKLHNYFMPHNESLLK